MTSTTSTNTLWPNISGQAPPRGMVQMLFDAAGDISALTNNKIDFHIDSVGVGAGGAIKDIRHNCYLRVISNSYVHLLFRITSPVAGPFPASASTPEGDSFPVVRTETELRDVIGQILQRERTKDELLFLLNVTRP